MSYDKQVNINQMFDKIRTIMMIKNKHFKQLYIAIE